MKYLEMIVSLWIKAGLVIFFTALAIIVVLVVATNLWLVPIGLAVAVVIHCRRQRQPGNQSDLIDKIAEGAIGLMAIFAIGIGFILALVIAVRQPWLAVICIGVYWFWKKSHRQAIN